jgi:hypothetical protein
MSSLVALASVKHQVTDIEISSVNVFVVVASKILLIPYGVQ